MRILSNLFALLLLSLLQTNEATNHEFNNVDNKTEIESSYKTENGISEKTEDKPIVLTDVERIKSELGTIKSDLKREKSKTRTEIKFETYKAHVPEGYFLKSVAILHRHGDRTPIRSYPLDPYRDISNWPDGWGQLTTAGKQRMYKLGEYFRKRYSDFWPENIRQFYARSTDAERCLESANLVLAGCFPPTGRWIWKSNLNWVPIGVHTRPRASDALLNPSVVCPNADKDFKKLKASAEYQSYDRKYSHLYPFLTKHTGENVSNMIAAQSIFGILKVEREQGFKLPIWVTDDIWDQLRDLYDIKFYLKYSTKTVQRIRTGPLFRDLKERFATPLIYPEISAGPHTKKVFFYSTHDTMVAAVLSTLQAFNRLAPPYGASVIFELYKAANSAKQMISIFYLNDTYTENPIKLNLSFCSNFQVCDYLAFTRYIESYIPQDWAKECGRPKKHFSSFA